MKLFLPLGLAMAIAIAPVAHAQSITSQFKTELATKLTNKTGSAAAKAAAQTIAKFVVKKPKGDPNKIQSFTKLANKSLKKLIAKTDTKAFQNYNKFWSKLVMFNYFKKGKIPYDPADKKFTKALGLMLKFLPPVIRSQPAIVQAGFNQLKTNNKKLSTAADRDANLAILQQEVAEITGVEPVS